MSKKIEAALPIKEVICRAPARLHEIYEHVGFRVRLLVEREDGRDLSPGDQVTARAIVAGYEADERRPEVTAAQVNVLEGLEQLANAEAKTSAKKPRPLKAQKNTR